MKIKYTYQFSNENVTIEVDEADYEILVTLDQEEYNSNRKHNRRYPISLEARLDTSNEDRGLERRSRKNPLSPNGETWDASILADGTDILGNLIHKYESEHIRSAVDKLKPTQRDLILAIYFDGMSVNDYADREGVDHSAISHRLQTAYKNLKKLL